MKPLFLLSVSGALVLRVVCVCAQEVSFKQLWRTSIGSLLRTFSAIRSGCEQLAGVGVGQGLP